MSGSGGTRERRDASPARSSRAPSGGATPRPSERWAAFYLVVRSVPRGRVTTYGEVAMLAGAPGYARHVGHALAALRGTRHRVPWQRVLAKDSARRGRIAILDAVGAAAQRELLTREGVEVGEDGRVDLAAHGWRTATKRSLSQRPAHGKRKR